MGLYVANISFQQATRHHPADVVPRCMLPRPCRVHIRSGRMSCVAAAPSTVDSKTRPGEKKGNRVLCKNKLIILFSFDPSLAVLSTARHCFEVSHVQ